MFEVRNKTSWFILPFLSAHYGFIFTKFFPEFFTFINLYQIFNLVSLRNWSLFCLLPHLSYFKPFHHTFTFLFPLQLFLSYPKRQYWLPVEKNLSNIQNTYLYYHLVLDNLFSVHKFHPIRILVGSRKNKNEHSYQFLCFFISVTNLYSAILQTQALDLQTAPFSGDIFIVSEI